MCRNCGALIGAEEQSCGQCGATAGASMAAQTHLAATERPPLDRDAMRFARAILTRPATFTFVFIIANVFIFLLTVFAAGGTSEEWRFNAVLIAYGAKLNSLINAGQWWRFVTPVFLHGSFVHLLMNMYGLWILGPYVERLYGSAKFVFFWVLTGICGVLASYMAVRPALHNTAGPLSRFLFRAEDAASVGASGALFGLIGVLFVFGIKFRHELPEGFKRAFGTGMLPTILINIFIGYVFPFIDNSAHMGGLAAGALLALFVGYKRPHERAEVAVLWHVLQVAALALVVLSFFMVWRHYSGPPLALTPEALQRVLPGNNTSNVPAYVEAMNAGQKAFITGLNKMDAAEIDPAIKQLESVPSLDEKPDAIRNDLKALLVRAREFAAQKPEQRQNRRAQTQLKELLSDYQAWEKSFDEWVKTDGEKYGLKLSEPQPTAPEASPSATQSPSNGK
ncbi:MAG: rhomboid family intramembrane serine protease [Acidobacteria bacterium]|nr:rhomboid family intramembrane serine protease [Acidobacteriota bacterium]